MKILFAASEAFPFCKTGGLADVAGSLPVSLAENGDQVAVILPLCVVSAAVYVLRRGVDLTLAAPYLLGGLIGGFLGGRLFPKVSAGWLRYLFAAFLLYGGVQYLL